MTSLKKLREFQIGDKVVISLLDDYCSVGDYGTIVGIQQESHDSDELCVLFKRHNNDDVDWDVQYWISLDIVISYPHTTPWKKIKSIADIMMEKK